jgi:hypothetical protein
MSYFAITPQMKVFSGTIGLAVFVKGDASNDNGMLQCGAGDSCIGVSTAATNTAPGTPGATSVAASVGQSCAVYGPGSIVEIQVGAGGAAGPGYVKSDANGCAQNASTGDTVCAWLFQQGAVGTFVLGMVLPPNLAVIGSGSSSNRTITTNTTLTSADNGKNILVNQGGIQVTLPSAASVPGMFTRVVSYAATATLTAGATGTQIVPATGDMIIGNGYTGATNKSSIDVASSAVQGDTQSLISDGVGKWIIVATEGTWVRQS